MDHATYTCKDRIPSQCLRLAIKSIINEHEITIFKKGYSVVSTSHVRTNFIVMSPVVTSEHHGSMCGAVIAAIAGNQLVALGVKLGELDCILIRFRSTKCKEKLIKIARSVFRQ